jgi:hypothetical protein
MSENEGILQLQPSGRWAVVRPGRIPVEITSSVSDAALLQRYGCSGCSRPSKRAGNASSTTANAERRRFRCEAAWGKMPRGLRLGGSLVG